MLVYLARDLLLFHALYMLGGWILHQGREADGAGCSEDETLTFVSGVWKA